MNKSKLTLYYAALVLWDKAYLELYGFGGNPVRFDRIMAAIKRLEARF